MSQNIQSIQIKLVDPQKVKKFHLVESADTWDQNTPVHGGLFGLNLGKSKSKSQ